MLGSDRQHAGSREVELEQIEAFLEGSQEHGPDQVSCASSTRASNSMSARVTL